MVKKRSLKIDWNIPMKIKGFEKLSLIDYPDHIACVIFLAGCNFRCHFCYNKNLVIDTHFLPDIKEEVIYSYLRERKKILEGIVVSGGEPTVHQNLPEFIQRLQRFCLPIKLDTNGTHPEIVQALLEQKLVQYIAVDIKVPLNTHYLTLTHIKPALIFSIKQTLRLLVESRTPFELRTTVIPTVHNRYVWTTMREQVVPLLGEEASNIPWYVQPFIPGNCLDQSFNKLPPTQVPQLQEAVHELQKSFPKAAIRA